MATTINLPANRETNWDVKLNAALNTLVTATNTQNAALADIQTLLTSMSSQLTALNAAVGTGVVWQA